VDGVDATNSLGSDPQLSNPVTKGRVCSDTWGCRAGSCWSGQRDGLLLPLEVAGASSIELKVPFDGFKLAPKEPATGFRGDFLENG